MGTRVGVAFVSLTTDNSGLRRGFAEAKALGAQAAAQYGAGFGRIAQTSRQLQTIGSGLTRYVSLPLAALAGASVKVASDFSTALTRVRALAAATGPAFANMREDVLSLSNETGQAATDIADSLYIVASAGLRTKDVFPVLEMATKGAAAQMASASTLGDLLTSALVNFGKEGLTAANAMDVLTVAIQEGKAEPEALSASLGTVLPVAQQLGVTFDEVAGMISSLTNRGIEAQRAATGLRYLMITLENPSEQAKEDLDKVGLSIGELQRVIEQQGLTAALNMLATKLDLTSAKGKEMFFEILGGVRAGHIATALATGDQRNLQAILGKTEAAAGGAGDAFQTAYQKMRQTPEFKFQLAFNELKNAAIEAGDALLPIAQQIVEVLGGVAESFANLPDPIQKSITSFGLFAIALGPVMAIVGSLGRLIVPLAGGLTNVWRVAAGAMASAPAMGTQFRNMQTGQFVSGFQNASKASIGFRAALSSLSPVLKGLAFGAAIAGAGLLINWFIRAGDAAKQFGQTVREELESGKTSIQQLQKDIAGMGGGNLSFGDFVRSPLGSLEDQMKAQAAATQLAAYNAQLDNMSLKALGASVGHQKLAENVRIANQAVIDGADATGVEALALQLLGDAANQASNQLIESVGSWGRLVTVAQTGSAQTLEQRKQFIGMVAALDDLGVGINFNNSAILEAVAASGDYGSAMDMLGRMVGDQLINAIKTYDGALDNHTAKAAIAAAKEGDLATAIQLASAAMMSAAAHADEIAAAQENFAERFKQTPFTTGDFSVAGGPSYRQITPGEMKNLGNLNDLLQTSTVLSQDQALKLSLLLARYNQLGLGIDNAAAAEYKHAIATGKVGEMTRYLTSQIKAYSGATEGQVKRNEELANRLLTAKGALDGFGVALSYSAVKSDAAQEQITRLVDAAYRLKGGLDIKEQVKLTALLEDGKARQAIKYLRHLIEGKPAKFRVDVETKINVDKIKGKAGIGAMLGITGRQTQDVKVGANTTEAEQEFRALSRQIENGDAKMPIGANTSKADAELTALRQRASKPVQIPYYFVQRGPDPKTPGRVPHSGGWIYHRGGRVKPDEVEAILQKGEFVVNRSSAKKYGSLLEAINYGGSRRPIQRMEGVPNEPQKVDPTPRWYGSLLKAVTAAVGRTKDARLDLRVQRGGQQAASTADARVSAARHGALLKAVNDSYGRSGQRIEIKQPRGDDAGLASSIEALAISQIRGGRQHDGLTKRDIIEAVREGLSRAEIAVSMDGYKVGSQLRKRERVYGR